MTAARGGRADLMNQLERMVSEGRNPRTMGIDLMSSIDILQTMNAEDATVSGAVQKVIPDIAHAVDATVTAFNSGGRLVYIGAGTSGRLGVLDASECPPTFGVPAEMVVGIIAGGFDALIRAAEGAEDDAEAAVADLMAIDLSHKDIVVGIAVSGRTPYVIGALNHARSVGATAISLCCNPGSPISEIADIAITPVVGPEVVTGSTRLKSGSAQKLVLNMISTASMIRIGKTFENLMVDLHASNEKLLARAVLIVMRATGCTPEEAHEALEKTGNDAKLAILVLTTGLQPDAARRALDASNGFLRSAIKASISEQDFGVQ